MFMRGKYADKLAIVRNKTIIRLDIQDTKRKTK